MYLCSFCSFEEVEVCDIRVVKIANEARNWLFLRAKHLF